ncbi:MAG: O-antigen ligase family protein [Candidatus Solibacter sp.]
MLQAAALALIALILAPGLLFYFDVTPKLVVLLLAAGLSLLPLRRSALTLLAVLTLAWLALCTALSSDAGLSFRGTHWRQFGALGQAGVVILAWALSAQTARVGTWLRVISVAGAGTAVYGIAQYFGWDPILPKAAYHVGEGIWTIVRPPSTLGYVSYFATWLLFAVFMSVALPGRVAKVCAGLAAIALVFTGSRAALVGLGAGAAVWLYWRGYGLPRRLVWGTLAATVALAALYVSPLGQPLRSRARWFAEDPWGGARPLLWRDSLSMGMARPLTGFGPETFTASFPRYQSKALARAYPEFAHESPHNMFLDALVGQGIVGVALLAAWCVLGFAAMWKLRATRPEIAAGLAAALAAGIVSQQFTVFTIVTAAIFFATIGLAWGLASDPRTAALTGAATDPIRAATDPIRAATDPIRAATVRERWFFNPAQSPVYRLPLALPLVYFALRLAWNDHALALAQRDLAAGNLKAAAAHYAASGRTSDLWYSRALLDATWKAATIPDRLEALHRASEAGERATRTAEAPFNAWYSLSSIRAAQNNVAGAEQCLRAAIEAHPTWFKPHWMLAQVLRLQGRDQEATRESTLAAELDGGVHPEVARTLHELQGR